MAEGRSNPPRVPQHSKRMMGERSATHHTPLCFLNRKYFSCKPPPGCGLQWWMDLHPSQSASDAISAKLRMILRGLLAALGLWRMTPTMSLMVHRRISRTFGRIERLLLRFQTGRLWRLKPRAAAQRRPAREAAGSPALPRRFGWLVRAGGHQAAGFGTQLQTMLATPEMVALLAASPQAARILRPLCRALAVELPWTVTPPRTPKPRKSRPKPEPFKIPLPRGVLTAIRQRRFCIH